MSKLIESGHFYTRAVVRKWDPEQTVWAQQKLADGRKLTAAEFDALGVSPVEVAEGEQPGNLLANVGIAQMLDRLLTAEQAWDNTHVGLAVGDSTTAAAASDTDLVAATNKRYNAMDATFPSRTNQTIDFKATYGSSEANFAWEEYGVVVPNTATAFSAGTTKPTDYILFNRKVTSLGTKASGATWEFTVSITIS